MKKFIGFLFVIAVLAECCLLWWIKTGAPGGPLGWVETADASVYYGPGAPDPPYRLSPEDRELLVNAVADAHALSSASGEFDRITALRNWARSTCPEFGTKSPPTNDPSDILQSFESGVGGSCGSIASVYAAALIAHGYRARIVQLIRDDNDIPRWTSGPPDTHLEVEVFSPDHQKWIVSDPTFNCWFHRPDSDAPLSARELQLIATEPGTDFSKTGWIPLTLSGTVVAEYDGYDTHPKVSEYYIDPVLLFRNIFILYYDIYGSRPEDPVQKYSQLVLARLTGSEKIVRLLAPGQKPSIVLRFNQAANWLPVVGLVLLVMLLVPSGSAPQPEGDETDEVEDDEEE